MSRGLRDDVRADRADRVPDREIEDRTVEAVSKDARPGVPMRHLDLPRTDRREPVNVRDRVYHLRASEARLLATVGTFRSVAAHDLEDLRSSRDSWRGDLQRLGEQGLLQRAAIVINRQPTSVVTLTKEGRDLLTSRQEPRDGRPSQTYYAELVKPRELAHDAQLYRVFQAEAAKIEIRGGRIDRVLLDFELKREYQRYLNRPDRPSRVDSPDHAGGSMDAAEIRAFATAWDLPIIDGHLELPDVRIEYELPDGRFDHRDVELVTEHYSRSQLAGKVKAGFARYRAAGAGRGGARTGGTPLDPHHLDWLR